MHPGSCLEVCGAVSSGCGGKSEHLVPRPECVRHRASAREMAGIGLLVQHQGLPCLAMPWTAAKQPNRLRVVDGDGKCLALWGDDDLAFSSRCTNGTNGTGNDDGDHSRAYRAWKAGIDATIEIFARLVEGTLRDRVFTAGERKDDGIAFFGREFIRGIELARHPIRIFAHRDLVAFGQGQWEKSEREKGGEMHDGRRRERFRSGVD